MLRYSNFLFSVLFRKASTYIAALLLIVGSLGMLLLRIDLGNAVAEQALFPYMPFHTWLIFILSTIFVAIISLRIFKTGEQDGTELLISAKPITRKQLIFGKFFTLFVVILGFHLIMFILLFVATFVDKYATTNEQLAFAGSIAVGGVIISLIMSSIIVLLATALSKVWTMVLAILFTIIFPISSLVITPISKANFEVDRYSDERKSFKGIRSDTRLEELYEEDKSYSIASQNTHEKLSEHQKSWYKTFAYFDVWYQWERLFSSFQPKHTYNSEGEGSSDLTPAQKSVYDKNYDLKKEEFFDKYGIKVKDESEKAKKSGVKNPTQKIAILFTDKIVKKLKKISFDYRQKYSLTTYDAAKLKTFAELIKKYENIKGMITKNNIPRYPNDINIGKNKYEIFEIALGIKKGTLEKNEDVVRLLLYKMIQKHQKHAKTKGTNMFIPYDFQTSDNSTRVDSNKIKDESETTIVFENLRKISYIETKYVLLVWSGITILLVGLSMLVYLRRDFK